MSDIQTSCPGFAYNFDPVTQLCDVQLAIEHLFEGLDEAYKLVIPNRLQRVQVQFPQGGEYALTHPVPDGTPVLAHFATRGISHFKNFGKTEAGLINGLPAPQFFQKYSFDNATCTIGNQPVTSAIKDFNTSAIELRNKDRSQRVTLNDDGSIDITSGKSTIHMDKDGNMTTTVVKYTVKADSITLDGEVSCTKGLSVKGDATVVGEVSTKGLPVSTHIHKNPEGGYVGPMEK